MAGDSDTFEIDLSEGQTVTVLLVPLDVDIEASLEMRDPDGELLASGTAAEVGQPVLLQTVPAANAGVYSITGSSLAGIGRYELEVYLNAALEDESVSGVTNNDTLTAEDLGAAFIPLGSDRAAVLGIGDGETPDLFRFDLVAGQVASLAVSSLAAGAELLLLDSTGGSIAVAAGGHISEFVATSDDTFFASVLAPAGVPYDLVVTRDIALELESNDEIDTAMPLEATGHVLGSVGTAGGGGTIRVAVVSSGSQVTNQLNDDSYFDFTAVRVNGDQVDSLEELSQYDVVVIGDSGVQSQLDGMAEALRLWVESGGGLVATGWTIYSAGASTSPILPDIDAVVPVDTTVYYDYFGSGTVTITDNTHPITEGLADVFYNSNVEFSSAGADNDGVVLGQLGGQDVVVAANKGAGRSVYLGGVYHNRNFGSGDPDRLLEQAVAWASGDPLDAYSFAASEGATLDITTSTPLGGVGLPENTLDPRITLFDPTGTEVDSDDNEADGRNALISYTIPEGGAGRYVLIVESAAGTSGEYTIDVQGAIFGSPFNVSAVTPADGDRLPIAPDEITIVFNDFVALPTLEARDLTVDGQAADDLIVVDGKTVIFLVSGLGEGQHVMVIADGAIEDLQGTAIDAFVSTFDNDFSGPRVTSSTVQEDDIINVGSFIYEAEFSEPLDEGNLDNSDFLLESLSQGGSYTPISFSYDVDSLTLTLEYPELPEGNYQLTLFSGDGRLEDPLGNDLDGEPVAFPLPPNVSGDGVPGGDFFVHFVVDTTTVLFPVPLLGLAPAGSLMYGQTARGLLDPQGDLDTFEVDLEGSQSATLIFTPQDPSIQSRVTLRGPDGAVLAEQTAGAANERVLLNNVAAADAGTYTVEVESVAGAGEFELELVLNALWEAESFGGGSNDALADAEDLSGASISLGGAADRLALLGMADAGGDYFAFEMAASSRATIVLTVEDGTPIDFELLDSNGNLLAIGADTATNVTWDIREFAAPEEGVYYLHVGEGTGEAYSLLVTRSSTFDLEPNSEPESAALLLSGTILGTLGGGGDTGGTGFAYVRSTVGQPWGNSENENAMDRAFGSGNWDDLRYETVNAQELFSSTYSFVFMEGSDDLAIELETFLNANIGLVESFVARGNTVFINAAPNEGDGMSFGFGGVVLFYPDSGRTVTAVDPSHPVLLEPFTPTATTYTGSSFSHASVRSADLTPIIVDENGDAVLAEMQWGAGVAVFGGMTTPNYHSPTIEARNLRANILAYSASQGGDGQDYHAFSVLEGDRFTITTETPGTAAGQPVNELDPGLELVDPDGVVVPHTNQSGNEILTRTATKTGVYLVRVFSETDVPGDYVLSIADNAGPAPPLVVVESDPEDVQNCLRIRSPTASTCLNRSCSHRWTQRICW